MNWRNKRRLVRWRYVIAFAPLAVATLLGLDWSGDVLFLQLAFGCAIAGICLMWVQTVREHDERVKREREEREAKDR